MLWHTMLRYATGAGVDETLALLRKETKKGEEGVDEKKERRKEMDTRT